MKRPEPVTPQTPTTKADYTIAAAFWGAVIGWPLFVILWRWLSR